MHAVRAPVHAARVPARRAPAVPGGPTCGGDLDVCVLLHASPRWPARVTGAHRVPIRMALSAPGAVAVRTSSPRPLADRIGSSRPSFSERRLESMTTGSGVWSVTVRPNTVGEKCVLGDHTMLIGCSC